MSILGALTGSMWLHTTGSKVATKCNCQKFPQWPYKETELRFNVSKVLTELFLKIKHVQDKKNPSKGTHQVSIGNIFSNGRFGTKGSQREGAWASRKQWWDQNHHNTKIALICHEILILVQTVQCGLRSQNGLSLHWMQSKLSLINWAIGKYARLFFLVAYSWVQCVMREMIPVVLCLTNPMSCDLGCSSAWQSPVSRRTQIGRRKKIAS